MEMKNLRKPVIALTMGDPTGIGPEISLLTAMNAHVFDRAHLFIIGDIYRLEESLAILQKLGRVQDALKLRSIKTVSAATYEPLVVNVMDLQNVPEGLPWGELSPVAGQCAYEYLARAVQLSLDHTIDAICTAPLNKEAWQLAGIPYPGHTEALAALSGSPRSAMMLVNKGLRVVHVTTHVRLKQAIQLATTTRILDRIRLTADFLSAYGLKNPRIVVAGLNPHAGEGGLFGDEEEKEIFPAVQQAQGEGLCVTGPLPPDSVYVRAASGEFDAVIAMYHDQGHIAIKMLGFDSGVNVTIGLPILRTSVDHGTAFDIAGKGMAREESMVESVLVAVDLLRGPS